MFIHSEMPKAPVNTLQNIFETIYRICVWAPEKHEQSSEINQLNVVVTSAKERFRKVVQMCKHLKCDMFQMKTDILNRRHSDVRKRQAENHLQRSRGRSEEAHDKMRKKALKSDGFIDIYWFHGRISFTHPCNLAVR